MGIKLEKVYMNKYETFSVYVNKMSYTVCNKLQY